MAKGVETFAFWKKSGFDVGREVVLGCIWEWFGGNIQYVVVNS
jgi:hypothetical protein